MGFFQLVFAGNKGNTSSHPFPISCFVDQLGFANSSAVSFGLA